LGIWTRTLEGMAVNPSFWRGKRVFLTGHTGFKGSWLALWLAEVGAEVTGYSLPAPTTPSLFEQARVKDSVRHISGDVRDFATLKNAIIAAAPEVVFHLAAQALVRESYRTPVETYSTNVIGTANLLETVRQVQSVRAVVIVTSDKCYENREIHAGYTETDAMGGDDPYSSSKGCAELVTHAYRHSFFRDSQTAIASARAGNVIGGGDWAMDRLVPDIMRSMMKGEPVLIRNPHAIRPWQHVLEPLSGYVLLAERLFADSNYCGGWNFGPAEDDAKPVSWVVDQIVQLWGPGASWVLDRGQHPHEATLLRLDCRKAAEQLGWNPVWQLQSALRETVNWYRGYAAGKDCRALALGQIEQYQNAVPMATAARQS
jgi:CDP-glucose 4,6-dehydratase